MKYIKKLTWLLAIGAGLATTSCSESDDVQIPGGLAIDKEQIEIGAEGGTQQLAISASQNWVSSVDEPWLMLNPANGVGSATANVVVDTTLMNGRRSTDIDFIGENGQRRTITVVQFGFGKQIDIKDPVVEIDNSAAYDKREFESIISANVDCKIGEIEYSFEGNLSESEKADYESEREGWLLNSKNEDKLKNTNLGIELDRKARPRSVKFKFRWNMNIVPAERVAKVHLMPQNADDKLVDADGNETSLYHQVWQAGVILLPVQSVGVMGDERTYERAVALRAVTSTDAMTADWAHLPYEFLGKVSNDIINKVKGVNRVTYDISSKPPSTIEWE